LSCVGVLLDNGFLAVSVSSALTTFKNISVGRAGGENVLRDDVESSISRRRRHSRHGQFTNVAVNGRHGRGERRPGSDALNKSPPSPAGSPFNPAPPRSDKAPLG
jgi:hypothetical protein